MTCFCWNTLSSVRLRNSVMRYTLASILLLSMSMANAAELTLAWDNAEPLAGQEITGTEVRVDGVTIGTTEAEEFVVDLTNYPVGESLSFTVRHVGTVNGIAAVGLETEPLIYTIAEPIRPPVSIRIEITIN